MQQTLVLVKPDAVERGLVGVIITRLEQRGLKLLEASFVKPSLEMCEAHYEQHRAAEYFERITTTMAGGNVMAMIWHGPNAVLVALAVRGPTNPALAPPGSVRGDYCNSIEANAMHASDCTGAVPREMKVWFS